LMYDFQGLNYRKIADEIDVVSWDTYPLWDKYENIDVARDTGMQHDYMRSLKDKPFLLMECCPSSTNWQGVSKLKKPGVLLSSSLQTIAHGSDSVQYFQIRQSRGSSEKFHGAVIDHYGGETRVFKEISEIGMDLEKLSEIGNTKVNANVALIYDVENRWAMEDAQGPRNKGLYYHESALKSYKALKNYGLDVDVISMEAELSKYKVVVAPMLYMYREGIQEKMENFVANSGILITTYWSGVVDENDLCFLGESPNKMVDVLGLRREEIDGLYDWESNGAIPVTNNSLGISNEYTCKNLCELVEVRNAEVLMTYSDDFYRGNAVLTCNEYKKGKAYYIGADMGQDFYDDVYNKIFYVNNIESLMKNLSKNVDVSSREDDNYKYLFLQNFGKDTVSINLPVGDVLIGNSKGKLEAFETIVLKIKI
ncbi:MAG: beta-galactosidase, partial [Lachnospirales bacterium]